VRVWKCWKRREAARKTTGCMRIRLETARPLDVSRREYLRYNFIMNFEIIYTIMYTKGIYNDLSRKNNLGEPRRRRPLIIRRPSPPAVSRVRIEIPEWKIHPCGHEVVFRTVRSSATDDSACLVCVKRSYRIAEGAEDRLHRNYGCKCTSCGVHGTSGTRTKDILLLLWISAEESGMGSPPPPPLVARIMVAANGTSTLCRYYR